MASVRQLAFGTCRPTTIRAPAAAQKFRSMAGLFAGIGGLEKGLGEAGHSCQILCEIDPSARAVLQARREFEGVRLESDVNDALCLDCNGGSCPQCRRRQHAGEGQLCGSSQGGYRS